MCCILFDDWKKISQSPQIFCKPVQMGHFNGLIYRDKFTIRTQSKQLSVWKKIQASFAIYLDWPKFLMQNVVRRAAKIENSTQKFSTWTQKIFFTKRKHYVWVVYIEWDWPKFFLQKSCQSPKIAKNGLFSDFFEISYLLRCIFNFFWN